MLEVGNCIVLSNQTTSEGKLKLRQFLVFEYFYFYLRDKEANVITTELRQTEHPTHPKTTDKVMVEELNENAVYSATKLKYRGLALQHPRIRAQESAHRLDGSRKANAVEMSQQKQSDVQTSSKLKKKGPGLEFTSVKRTANVRQVNELRQAGALLSGIYQTNG